MSKANEVGRLVMRPQSGWLRSTSHEKFAAAMAKCQHHGAFCAADGFCHYGDCFKPIEKQPDILQRMAALEARIEQLESDA